MPRARVIAAYATVKVLDPATGKPTVYGFHQGAVLPDTADPENVANLVRRGYCEWLDSSEAKAVEKQEVEAGKAGAAAAEQNMAAAEAAAAAAEKERVAAEKAAAKAAKA